VTSVAENLAAVRERVAGACLRAGRDPATVRIVAASKTQPAGAIREALAAGVDAIGENRVQEAAAKRPLVRERTSWHLIGPLQRNKARTALELFDVIETVDGTTLADRLESLLATANREATVLLEVNVGGEAQKNGVAPEHTPALVDHLLTHCRHLTLRGLMTVPPYASDPEASRPHFVALRQLAEALRKRFDLPPLELSMGMSEDYAVAVEEGASWIRVGRALFGERHTTV